MKRKCLAVGLAILAGTAAVALSGQERAPLKLGSLVRSAVLPRFLGPPRFENGFRPEIRVEGSRVRLYGPAGSEIRANEIILPGAESFKVEDASVSRSGLMAVAAAGVSSAGAVAGTIVLFDNPGPPRLVIRTSPFYPSWVAIDPDSYIWIAGSSPPTAPSEQKVEQYVLQKYSLNGSLVGSFLKRSSFNPEVHPWRSTSRGFAALRASAAGVGLYVPHQDGSGEWVELTLAGELKGRWTAPAPADGVNLSFLGFTDSGSVYALWTPLGSPGSGTCRLNKSTSTWEPLEDPPVGPRESTGLRKALFIGTDGNLLVFLTSLGPNRMVFYEEPPK